MSRILKNNFIPDAMEMFAIVCFALCAFSSSVYAQAGEPCNGRTVSCFVDPCSVASCPGVANAVCVPNFCNTCSATFVVSGVTVSQQDCGETSLSRTSAVEVANPRGNSGLLGGGRGIFGRPARRDRTDQIGSGSSPLLNLLFGDSRSSGSSGSPGIRVDTPQIFRDIASRVSQWQPLDANARGKMENFVGGLLSKIFNRLG